MSASADGRDPRRLRRRQQHRRQLEQAAPASATSASTRQAPATKGGTLKLASQAPSAAINPLTVADAGGLCMLAQTGEFLTFDNNSSPAARADARDELEAEQGRHGVDVQAALGRQVPRRLSR